jgi:hypothetical protein
VKELKDEKVFYDHSLTKSESPAGISMDDAKGSASHGQQTGATPNLPPSSKNVEPAD